MGVRLAEEHTGPGIASLVLGIVALTSFVPRFIRFIFGFIALILGVISYFGESEDSFGLAGFILGAVSIFESVIQLETLL